MIPDDLGAVFRDLFAMWVETDRDRRRATIERYFAPGARFSDHDGVFDGYEGLETFSDGLQSRLPGFRFRLDGEPESVGDAARAFWRFGPPDSDGGATGMDFVIFNGDGRITALYAFVRPPA